MPELVKNLWYDLARSVTWATMTMGFSLRIEGAHHLPRDGPVLVLGNHQSFLDPPTIGVAACGSRRLTYFARKSLFRNRYFRWLIASLKAIPVDQEGVAKEGLKVLIERLELG